MHSFVFQEPKNASTAPRAAKVPVQPKLRTGAIDDPLEREADRAAEAVLAGDRIRSPGPAAAHKQRKCTTCAQGDEQTLNRKEAASPAALPAEAPASVQDVLSSPGQPLDAAQRAYFEPRFGHDFGDVRVHSDLAAASSALSLGATAYTVGHDIVFSAGHFAPETPTGCRLIAHELMHVVQQRHADPFIQRDPLPQYKNADSVVELKPVIKPEGDAWQLTVEGDFSTPEAVGKKTVSLT